MLKENIVAMNETQLDMIKKVTTRVADKLVHINDNVTNLLNKDSLEFIINSGIINRQLRTDETAISFKHGSALSKINTRDAGAFNSDIDTIASLYFKEASMFLRDMREVISPAIKDMSDLINNNFETNRIKMTSKYNVKILGEIELFRFLEENDMLRVVGNGLLPKGAMLGFPLGDVEDIRSLFITGDSNIDEMARTFLSSQSDEDLRSFWNKYLLDFSGSNSLLNELDILHFRNVDVLILLYLSLHNILNGKVNYTLNMTAFENNKVNISDFLNTVINKYNTYINKFKDINLVMNYRFNTENNDFVIYLSGDLYNEYLNTYEFGIDAIIGYVITSYKNNGEKYVSVEELVKNGESYVERYKNSYNLETLANVRKNIDIKKQTLKVLIDSFLGMINAASSKTSVVKLVNEDREALFNFINGLEDKSLEDTLKISSKIFNLFNKEIGDFIVTMEGQKRFLSGTEDMSKEAALYAVITRLLNKLFEDTVTTKVQ